MTYTEAGVNNQPWVGHWWPDSTAVNGPHLFDANGPLAKYDAYVLATRGYDPHSRDWELKNAHTTDPSASWWGHCDARAVASMLTPDAPASGVKKAGVQFSQDDLEGLLTSVYTDYDYKILPGGVRSNTDDRSAPEFKDMNPAWFDYLLRYYVGTYHFPFVADIATGKQVWNYPVVGYKSWSQDNQDGSRNITTRVWFSDAAAGVKDGKWFTKDYTYRVWNTADGHSDGEWVGQSVSDHPDFAWVPTGRTTQAVRRNPNVDPNILAEILGRQSV